MHGDAVAKTNPTRIPGRWREGYALDLHTVSSTFVGDDEYGHPVFDTKRSELGELLLRLKYRSDSSVVDELAAAATAFLREWNPRVDFILPVPPSRSRPQQPVLALAQAIGVRAAIPLRLDCIRRAKQVPELKNVFEYTRRLQLLQGAHTVEQAVVEGRRVLLFDDLFRSGATMNSISAALYDQGHAAEVFALTITRTRSKE